MSHKVTQVPFMLTLLTMRKELCWAIETGFLASHARMLCVGQS